MTEIELYKIALKQFNQSVNKLENVKLNLGEVDASDHALMLSLIHESFITSISSILGKDTTKVLFSQYKCDTKEEYIKKAVEMSLDRIEQR